MKVALFAAAAVLAANGVQAQAPSAKLAPTKSATTKAGRPTAAPSKAAKAQAPRTAVSLDCSKQADAKNLHGKERKSFRDKCKRAGGKG